MQFSIALLLLTLTVGCGVSYQPSGEAKQSDSNLDDNPNNNEADTEGTEQGQTQQEVGSPPAQ